MIRRIRPVRRPSFVPLMVLLTVVALSAVPRSGARAQSVQTTAPELEVVQIRPNFFMIAGGGGNVAVQVGDAGSCSSTLGRRRASALWRLQ